MERSYIVQELCENKDKVELECNGNCVLQKTMQLDQDNSNADNPELLVMQMLQFVSDQGPLDVMLESVQLKNKPVFFRTISTSPTGVFHPPRLLV